MTAPSPWALWWVGKYGQPPGPEHLVLAEVTREAWDDCAALYEKRIEQLSGDLIAAGEGHPVLVCPNCGAPSADYDGFGLVACPRDPAGCYCTHPSSDDGVCTICGHQETDP